MFKLTKKNITARYSHIMCNIPILSSLTREIENIRAEMLKDTFLNFRKRH
jgi:hypothetical protein